LCSLENANILTGQKARAAEGTHWFETHTQFNHDQ
jgi:hypothetical protein